MTDAIPEITVPGDAAGLDDGQLTATYGAARLGVLAVPTLWLADEIFARWTGQRP